MAGVSSSLISGRLGMRGRRKEQKFFRSHSRYEGIRDFGIIFSLKFGFALFSSYFATCDFSTPLKNGRGGREI